MPRKLRVCYVQPAGGSVDAVDDAASEEAAIRGVSTTSGDAAVGCPHLPAARGGGAVQAVGERAPPARPLPRRTLRRAGEGRRDRQGVGGRRQHPLRLRRRDHRRTPDQLRRGGVLVVDRRHRRAHRPEHAADDELRVARAGHPAPGVPARRAARVRPRPGDDPRAPEPGGRGPDPVGQAQGVRVLRPAGLDRGRRRPEHLRRLRRGLDELHRVRPHVDHAVRDPRLTHDRHLLGRLEHRAVRARPVVHGASSIRRRRRG